MSSVGPAELALAALVEELLRAGKREGSVAAYRAPLQRPEAVAQAVSGSFHPSRLSRHAIREARRERISMAMVERAYDDPDAVRPSDHDELREIRSRWFGEVGVEVVVDTDDLRVVTVWRRGPR